jgi:DNA-binding response OmpR family regulator
VLTHEALIEHVWGYGSPGDRVLLKQLVRRLRLKIEADPSRPARLLAVPGVGYTLGKTAADGTSQ